MRNIIITKEYKYLGEYPLFKENGLPVGYLIDKGKVGCGGTSIALENDKDNTCYDKKTTSNYKSLYLND